MDSLTICHASITHLPKNKTLPLQPCNAGGSEDSADEGDAADDTKILFGSDDEEEESENDDWFDQLVNAQLSSEFSDADMGNEVSDSQVAPTELDTQILDDENPFASPWKDKPISDDVSRPVARPLAAEDKNLPVLVVNDSPERVNTAKIKADRIAQLKAQIQELEGELAQESSAFDGLGGPDFFVQKQFHFLYLNANGGSTRALPAFQSCRYQLVFAYYARSN